MNDDDAAKIVEETAKTLKEAARLQRETAEQLRKMEERLEQDRVGREKDFSELKALIGGFLKKFKP